MASACVIPLDLRSLRLRVPLLQCKPLTALLAPAAGSLRELAVCAWRSWELGVDECELGSGWAGFSSLTSLDLSAPGLCKLPAGFSSLTAVKELRVAVAPGRGGPPSGYGQLAALARTLTRISLRGLGSLPGELSALTGLRDLELSEHTLMDDSFRGEAAVSLQPLQPLSHLTTLRVSRMICSILQPLASLSSLQTLILERCFWAGGTEALAQLFQLRTLVLSDCGLQRLLPQLAAMPQLADLSLAGKQGAGCRCFRAWQRLQ